MGESSGCEVWERRNSVCFCFVFSMIFFLSFAFVGLNLGNTGGMDG